jgi:diacylglycerol kinase (ATP)
VVTDVPTRALRRDLPTLAIPPGQRRQPPQSRPIQIVVTPGSGNGVALAVARGVRDVLHTRGADVRLDVFPQLEDLRRWTATSTSQLSLLVSVGGDATQSAAAMAAVRRSVPFLPVPAGFGNLFARAFRLPDGVVHVSQLLERGEVVRADVGLQNGEPFLCHASFGLLSDIQTRVEEGQYPRARWRRWVEYYRTAVRHLRDTPLPALRVTVDGRVVTEAAVVVSVANVETYGPWLRLTPKASPVDGVFDVFVMAGATKLEVLAKLLRRHLRLPGTQSGMVYRGRRVTVVSDSAREDLELLTGALPVLVRPETRRALVPTLLPDAAAVSLWGLPASLRNLSPLPVGWSGPKAQGRDQKDPPARGYGAVPA